jgi:hypothetical protein
MEKKEDLRVTFATTLRDALQRHRKRTGESGKVVCDKLGLGEKGYRWLRKISSKGISHVRTDRRADLQKICDHIGLAQSNLFDVGFGRAGTPGTDFAKVIALGIAEAARQSGIPTNGVEKNGWETTTGGWEEIGKKFQNDLEQMISEILHKVTGEFGRHLKHEIIEEALKEFRAQNQRKGDKQAILDKPLWDDKTTAFPLMRKAILEYHWRDSFEEIEIDEGTWQVTPLGNGCIKISVEATHRLFQSEWGHVGAPTFPFVKGNLHSVRRKRWISEMYLNGGWHIPSDKAIDGGFHIPHSETVENSLALAEAPKDE